MFLVAIPRPLHRLREDARALQCVAFLLRVQGLGLGFGLFLSVRVRQCPALALSFPALLLADFFHPCVPRSGPSRWRGAIIIVALVVSDPHLRLPWLRWFFSGSGSGFEGRVGFEFWLGVRV